MHRSASALLLSPKLRADEHTALDEMARAASQRAYATSSAAAATALARWCVCVAQGMPRILESCVAPLMPLESNVGANAAMQMSDTSGLHPGIADAAAHLYQSADDALSKALEHFAYHHAEGAADTVDIADTTFDLDSSHGGITRDRSLTSYPTPHEVVQRMLPWLRRAVQDAARVLSERNHNALRSRAKSATKAKSK